LQNSKPAKEIPISFKKVNLNKLQSPKYKNENFILNYESSLDPSIEIPLESQFLNANSIDTDPIEIPRRELSHIENFSDPLVDSIQGEIESEFHSFERGRHFDSSLTKSAKLVKVDKEILISSNIIKRQLNRKTNYKIGNKIEKESFEDENLENNFGLKEIENIVQKAVKVIKEKLNEKYKEKK